MSKELMKVNAINLNIVFVMLIIQCLEIIYVNWEEKLAMVISLSHLIVFSIIVYISTFKVRIREEDQNGKR